MRRRTFPLLLLLAVTGVAPGCAKSKPPPPAPAPAVKPTPPSTAPVPGQLTDEQRQEVMCYRREQAKLRGEQQKQRRPAAPRPTPSPE